jgi:iron complex transport system ATP-binding protein
VVYGDGAPIPAIREKIGWVGGQLDRELDPGMTCLDAVCTGRVAALGVYGTWTAADLEQAVDLLYQVGAQHLASRPYGLLSSGERQRVMLARAFAANPVLLLLDEPCAGLDPPSRADFLAALSDLLAQPSSPTLVHVTHHVEEITEEISHVALMAHGRLMAQGPIDRVLESGTLSALYGRTVLLERNSLGGWTLAVTPRHGPEVGFSSPVA